MSKAFSIAIVLIGLVVMGVFPAYSQCRVNFYGSGVNGNAWANLKLLTSPDAYLISYRFRSEHSGALDKVIIRFGLTIPGYAKGTGGCIRVELREDDGTRNHLPSDVVLASVDIDDPVSNHYYYPVIDFQPDPEVFGGRLYHLVFRNVTGQESSVCSCTGTECDPKENYVSIEQLYTPDGCDPQQPTISEMDLATLTSYDNGSNWSKNCYHTPVFSVYFVDQSGQGMGYIGARSGAPRSIGDQAMVRERFEVATAPLSVSAVSVRFRRTGGIDGQPFRIRLVEVVNEQTSDLFVGEIPASNAPTDMTWVTFNFPSAIQLISVAGYSYRLILESNSASYETWGLRDSSGGVMHSASTFSNGIMEFTIDNGTTWCNNTNASDCIDGAVNDSVTTDLQFYFTVVTND